MSDVAKDWRGTTIVEGQTVIYGAPVGRSIAMVEAVVDGFTDSGRVWLKVRHRAYGSWGSNVSQRVHVGPDRLTVVGPLPKTSLPLEQDKAVEVATKTLERHRESLKQLDGGGHAPDYWRRAGYRNGERLPDLTQEQADVDYRKFLVREIKKHEKKLQAL